MSTDNWGDFRQSYGKRGNSASIRVPWAQAELIGIWGVLFTLLCDAICRETVVKSWGVTGPSVRPLARAQADGRTSADGGVDARTGGSVSSGASVAADSDMSVPQAPGRRAQWQLHASPGHGVHAPRCWERPGGAGDTPD